MKPLFKWSALPPLSMMVCIGAFAGPKGSAEACDGVTGLTQPVICLEIQLRELTVKRVNGDIGIYVVIRASRAIGRQTRAVVAISAPGNASGIKLDSGSHAVNKAVEIKPGKATEPICLLDVRTAKDNPTSGTLQYTVSLLQPDASVEIRGSPQEVTVSTNP